jgi:hypothetical protein
MSILATKYSLMPMAGPILNQGQMSTCMQNAIVTGIDLIMRQTGMEIAPLSRLQNYYDTRQAQGTPDTDFGSLPKYAMNAAKNIGIGFESEWAYEQSNMFVKPSAATYAQASYNKITYTDMSIELSAGFLAENVKKMLAEGKPVVLAWRVRDYFMTEHGPLETQVNYGKGPIVGGHAVLIVGIDDNLHGGSYIVKNSWGTGWGDGGYGTIRYDQFAPNGSDGSGNYVVPDTMGMYAIDGFGAVNFKFTAERVTVAKEYATLLKRPAEIAGLDWWADTLAHGANKAFLADFLINSVEGQLYYGSDTNTEFVAEMYQNILGRAADAGGLAWWVNNLNSGVSRGTLANYLMDSVGLPGGEVAARDYLSNKTGLSSYITIAMQYHGDHDALMMSAIAAVDGNAAHTEIIKIGLQQDMGVVYA